MNYTRFFLLFILLIAVFGVWVYFEISEIKKGFGFEVFASKEFRFHTVAPRESFFPKLKEYDMELKRMTSMSEDRGILLFTEKKGRLLRKAPGTGVLTIYDFAKVPDFTDGNEGGLLCVVRTHIPGQIIVTYTLKTGETSQRLIAQICHFGREFSLGEIVFSQDYPQKYHHAGTLVYDRRGRLYLSSGDGGPQGDPQNVAQNLSSYRGKILRLYPGKDPEIIAYGLRNPWKISIDTSKEKDRMFVADVGDNNVESLYLLEDLDPQKPYNCGWNQYEGSAKYATNPSFPFEETLLPIFEYHNDLENKETPGKAIIGGYYIPEKNVYVFADYMSSYVYVLQPSPDSRKWIQVGKKKAESSILSLGKTECGLGSCQDLYILTSKGVYILTL